MPIPENSMVQVSSAFCCLQGEISLFGEFFLKELGKVLLMELLLNGRCLRSTQTICFRTLRATDENACYVFFFLEITFVIEMLASHYMAQFKTCISCMLPMNVVWVEWLGLTTEFMGLSLYH